MRACRWVLLLVAGGLWLPASAQFVIDDRLELGFDRPESWAMAYMTAATLFSGFGTPQRVEPGAIRIGAELGHIPHISTENRRVGLGGTKLEDLNKTPVFGRARLWIGLPADFTVELNWTPPVEIGGARPGGVFGAALDRPLFEHRKLRAGARVYYQTGRIRGDITCDADTASNPPGSPENPFGCRAPSNDRFDLNYYGAELSLAAVLDGGRFEPYAGFAVTRMEPRTRNNAETFSVIDRTLQVTEGTTRTLTAGVLYRPAERWEIVGALARTPLRVRRQPDFERSRDDLLSVRLMVRLSLR